MPDNILGPGNIIGVANGPADGDLQGNYPGPTIRSLKGVALSGSPGVGYGLVSTASNAATWIKQLRAIAPITSSKTLIANSLNPVEAATSFVVQLPGTQQIGTLCAVQKIDTTASIISVSGSIQGQSRTYELLYPQEAILFVTDENGSWWPVATYRTLAGLDSRYVGVTRTIREVAASGPAVTIPDPSIATVVSIVLTEPCTLTFPTLRAGKQFTLALIQDTTGSRTVTWPGIMKWPNATPPTLSTAPGAMDLFSFLCVEGAKWAGTAIGLNMS